MEDMIDEITNSLTEENISMNDNIFMEDNILMSTQYKPINIDINNYHDIVSQSETGSILFVDGGQAVVFESAGFSLGFIRICGIIYKDNKRISRNIKEFYILVREKDGIFSIKTFPESDFNMLIFRPDDESLKNGLERSNPSRIISVIRRFAELEFAKSQDSKLIDYIILDGTLEARYPYEIKYIKELLITQKVGSLSKTCSLMTKNGISITKKLFDMKKNSWYYEHIVENKNPLHPAEIYFVKLNDKSRHVFRFEVQNGFNRDLKNLFKILKLNSADPVFLGYPYGFVDVDSNARVSEEEKKSLQTRISVKLGKKWTEFSKSLNSMNAHDILDNLRF